MKLRFKGKNIEINAKVCNNFKKFIGLMFCRREKAKALLFEFKKSTQIRIHSCFVFFPFLALWLDKQNKIIDLKIVKPFNWNIFSGKSCQKVIEIPINKKYSRIVKILVEHRKV